MIGLDDRLRYGLERRVIVGKSNGRKEPIVPILRQDAAYASYPKRPNPGRVAQFLQIAGSSVSPLPVSVSA